MIRILYIDDDEEEYLLIRQLLAQVDGEAFAVEWVGSYESALEAIDDGGHDVYLLDYNLGARSGLELLRAALGRGCRAPWILLTGQGDRAVDLEAMREGAADYLAKERLDAPLLERAIRHAIERQRAHDAMRRLQGELEARVGERTAELSATNARLEAEVVQRRRLEGELRVRVAELAEVDRRKDTFLAMLAHELRNPLAPILHGAEILGRSTIDAATAAWARAVIERQARHLARLVDDLLDVTRILRGLIQLRKQAVDLAEVVARAVEIARPGIDDRGHVLSVSLPGAPVRLEGDPTRLVQVLENLLDNAAKFTHGPGGRIWLEAGGEPGQVVLRVRDNGTGMLPQFVPHVFDLFMQQDRALDHSHGGLGIGLTLVRGLVEQHGGTVGASSAGPGQGSEFVVRLPTANLAPPGDRVEPAPEQSRDPGARLRVLVVEDNADCAQALAILLRLGAHQVLIAPDGPAALEAARGFRPDVVLLDIGLPRMDGYEVARRLRALEGLERVTLVAVTGYGQDKDRRRARKAGFDHHLVKPVEATVLRDLLARVVPLAPDRSG
jgi:two-component system CheB/CheR fusion protein